MLENKEAVKNPKINSKKSVNKEENNPKFFEDECKNFLFFIFLSKRKN